MASGDAVSARALHPLRRPRLPRRATLLRAGLAAALLGLAAAVLHTPAGCPPGLAGSRPPPTGPSSGSPDGGPAPLPLPSGAVGVPVRLAEPAALAVVRPGARVDLLALPPGADGSGSLLASRALVLDVVGADALDAGSALYLALPPDQARRVVSQPEGSRFALLVRE
ncbi:flagellar biosynthesis protein FlgA [Micromonospora sp. S4605]|uniref:flagellar biosynthesis protein FlgA n=1 Tax=Micromonospora sp. S4605 TaxID=1420897 RepID=UPI000D6EEE41|nr:flagellar biosynthesis protein FlgA [Micromonospora sp. S4605]PWU56871.1 flagellar biosynthesis protein FlgA [Micromonospora sp. S4605]